MQRSTYIRPLIAGLSLAAASSLAFAQDKAPRNQDAQQSYKQGSSECHHAGKGHGHKGHAKKGGHHSRQGMMRLPEEVVQKLNLTDTQKVQYFDAQTETRAMMQGMREGMKMMRDQHRDQASTERFDPKVIFERQNERFAKMQVAREAIQKKWIGLWDSLNDQQKTVIQDYFQSRAKNH